MDAEADTLELPEEDNSSQVPRHLQNGIHRDTKKIVDQPSSTYGEAKLGQSKKKSLSKQMQKTMKKDHKLQNIDCGNTPF